MKLLYIDLFCGAGGTSTGVENARHDGRQCAKVIGCVNHDANAIASHAANHPNALHFTEDIRTLELSPLTAHIAEMRRQYPDAFVVLWASLECTNFSKAKGGQPRDADSRTLAEHLFRYIEAINPDYIQIENVEEFMSWGDLDENGKPISKDAGRLYQQWVSNVCGYGYRFAHRILNSADYGAYTTRRRFFGIFAKESLPIVFPEPTHSKDGATGLFGRTQRWKPVRRKRNNPARGCQYGPKSIRIRDQKGFLCRGKSKGITKNFKIAIRMKKILDACCGSRMCWFDKDNPDTVFMDCRSEEHTLCDGRRLEIRPDVVGDFRKMPFPDNSFYLVLFDPPHLNNLGESSWLAKKYGRLLPSWEDDIRQGFEECMRVLKPNGTLIFKWNEQQIPTARIIEIIGQKPLFGHTSGKGGKTIWMCFLKNEKSNETHL